MGKIMMVYAICETHVIQLGCFVRTEHLPETIASGELLYAHISRRAPDMQMRWMSKVFEHGQFRVVSSTRANKG